VSSDNPADLHMLNVIVRDMAASLDFYRRLGIAIPGEAADDHVQLKMPGGFSLELDTAGSARLWHAGWRADPASARVVLGFMLASRTAVDDRYAELIATGYRGRRPPFDAFWGARYAVVADPDGNDVGLMSPVEESRRDMAATAIPRALMLTRTRRRSAGPKIGTDPGPSPTPNPAPILAAPRGSGARGHIGHRHPALPN
jgi:catechol 2,3-dioxygenase-like lactoylglutathione lyase family enzyme